MTKPTLAITMGDPASIGPELSVLALSKKSTYDYCNPLIIGAAAPLRKAAEILNIPDISINTVSAPEEGMYKYRTIDVLEPVPYSPVEAGKVSKESGGYSFAYIKTAIGLALANKVEATVTNAISKEAINLAGHDFAGHTEIYAHFTDTSKYTMMLAHGDLRVVHVSTHVSLREACDRAKFDRVLEVIRIADQACKAMGVARPKVGVAGLNPHSGESGMFGTEEIDEIIPAIEAARTEGIEADGPVPPDSLFPKARGGWYDIVVAMYHDQGHIPLKMEGFVYNKEAGKWDDVAGVNVTLNLPIIRTSVDHGTAFDQAYKGTASPTSLLNAIEYAVAFAKNREKVQ